MSGSFDDGDEPKMWSCIIGTGASFNGGVAVALHGDEIVVAGPSKILFVDARTRAVAATVDVETGASLGGNQMGRVDAAATWVEAGLPGCSCPMARSSSPRLVGYHHTQAPRSTAASASPSPATSWSSRARGACRSSTRPPVPAAAPKSSDDPSPRTIHVVAAAASRPASTDYPRLSRGGVESRARTSQ